MVRSAAVRAAVATLLAIAPGADLSAQPIGRLGSVGDSISDEYFDSGFPYARSWTQILVEELAIDMGPLPSAAVEGGSWGEPRRTGYEDNWARYGATMDTALSGGQVAGVVDGIANRGVSHVVVQLGFNDIRPSTLAFAQIYAGLWDQVAIDAWIDGRIAALEAVLAPIEATDARIVLVALPDYTAFFLFRQLFTDPVSRERVEQAIEDLGSAMNDLARDHRLVLADFRLFCQAVFGLHDAPETEFLIGHVAIDLEAADTTSGENPVAVFVDDATHPNTIPQGIIANLMIEALNVYGTGIVQLSEEEVLGLAGVAYDGSDTVEGQIGPYSDYVRNYWSLLIDGFETGLDPWSDVVP